MWRILLCCVFVFLAGPSMAQVSPTASVPPTCDASFNDLMRNRAWMEAQREVEVAQAFIQKMDSVLNYSCFVQQAKASPAIFGKGPKGSVLATASANCLAMDAVWQAMQCADADRERIFPDLADLMLGRDVRACTSPTASAPYVQQRYNTWQSAGMRTQPGAYPAYVLAGYDQSVGFTWLQGKASWLQNKSNTPELNCASSAVIATGVKAIVGGKTVMDGVCVAPGCSFNGSGCELADAGVTAPISAPSPSP